MPGRIYFIEKDGNSGLRAIEQPEARMSALEGLNIEYGTLAVLSDVGINIAKGRVAAGAVVPPHAGDSLYGLYVLTGSGQLTLNADDGKLVSRISFEPGDLIVFPPHARHGWINDGTETFEWLGVDISEIKA